jgi:predicted metal-dependent hydrolase
VRIGELTFEFIRKPIKNLHISVLPPTGALRVAAPEAMTDTAVRMAVVKRIPWIKKQQAAFLQQARESARELVSGETHYLWGKRYRLEVLETAGKHRLEVGHQRFKLNVTPDTRVENRLKVIEAYYRQALKDQLAVLLPLWSTRLGVIVHDLRIQKMKTKWGSCAIENRRLIINLELAKKPIECLEYVLVHELAHLLERKHSERFVHILNQHLPDWQERKALLSVYPLSD